MKEILLPCGHTVSKFPGLEVIPNERLGWCVVCGAVYHAKTVKDINKNT